MADEEPIEYTCPECGSAFVEGAESCPVCGTAFDWSEETDYVCPECGARVPHDSKSCPECDAQFVVDAGAHDKGIESMLEAAVAETIVTPKRDAVPSEWEEAVPDASDVPAASEETVPAALAVEGDEDKVPEVPAPEEPRKAPEPAKATTDQARERVREAKGAKRPVEGAGEPAPQGASPKRRYPGGFSWVGLLFVILAGVALVLTVVALRWDAISSGSRYETIGSMQSMVIVAGIAGFILCAFVSMWDLLRGPRPIER